MSIQWRKDGQALIDDPPHITGTRSTDLEITGVILVDAGQYDAVQTNVCGANTSRQAELQVTCYPDCDISTGVGILDIFDFFCFQSAFVGFDPYADCDKSNILDIFDFLCFQDSFVAGEPYACDCDTTTGNGVCDVFDFLCFQNAFVGGCP